MANKKHEPLPEETIPVEDSPQTDAKPELKEAPQDNTEILPPQTELTSDAVVEDLNSAMPIQDDFSEVVELERSRARKKATKKLSKSDIKANTEEKICADDIDNASESTQQDPPARPRPIAIDGRLAVETEEDKAKDALLDLIESKKTGHILTDKIQGVEYLTDDPNSAIAVIYHGDYKVIIPAEEAVNPPNDYRGLPPGEVLHYLCVKRLGAEVDYIIKGIDTESCVAVASRLEAMKAKRKDYYYGTDRDGNNLIYAGVCAEARVVSVIRAGLFADLFGLEIYIPINELSYQRLMDASMYFHPGDRILVKVLEIDRSDRNQIKVTASVKQAGENPYEKALRKFSIGNRYIGTVSVVDANGVFVSLDGGIDCLCNYPKRGRPPRGARVTVRVLGIEREANRIWGVIVHVSATR